MSQRQVEVAAGRDVVAEVTRSAVSRLVTIRSRSLTSLTLAIGLPGGSVQTSVMRRGWLWAVGDREILTRVALAGGQRVGGVLVDDEDRIGGGGEVGQAARQTWWAD